jgi:hypothetical protein
MPKGALGQHPRQVQGGLRPAAAVSALARKSRRKAGWSKARREFRASAPAS